MRQQLSKEVDSRVDNIERKTTSTEIKCKLIESQSQNREVHSPQYSSDEQNTSIDRTEDKIIEVCEIASSDDEEISFCEKIEEKDVECSSLIETDNKTAIKIRETERKNILVNQNTYRKSDLLKDNFYCRDNIDLTHFMGVFQHLAIAKIFSRKEYLQRISVHIDHGRV